MTYRDYTSIPYPFLHDAMQKITENYSIKEIGMFTNGSLELTFQGKLSKEAVKDILTKLNPSGHIIEPQWANYGYSYDMQETYIYTNNDIDYRALEVA